MPSCLIWRFHSGSDCPAGNRLNIVTGEILSPAGILYPERNPVNATTGKRRPLQGAFIYPIHKGFSILYFKSRIKSLTFPRKELVWRPFGALARHSRFHLPLFPPFLLRCEPLIEAV